MSKSLGNCYTVSDLEEMGYPPLAFRYMCLNVHYRQKLNFTFDALASAKKPTNVSSKLSALIRKAKKKPISRRSPRSETNFVKP